MATILSLVLRLNTPLVLQADWHADDALFATHASHLLSGEWLGPYNLWTVAKGPGYPLFLTAVYKAHLPLALTQHVDPPRRSCCRWLSPLRASPGRAPSGWSSTASSPSTPPTSVGGPRRCRATFSTVRCRFSSSRLGLLLVAYLPSAARRGTGWLAATRWAAVGRSASPTALYYLTRDERPWLVPAVLAVAVVGAATWRRDIADRSTLLRAAWRCPRRHRDRRRHARVVDRTGRGSERGGVRDADHQRPDRGRDRPGLCGMAARRRRRAHPHGPGDARRDGRGVRRQPDCRRPGAAVDHPPGGAVDRPGLLPAGRPDVRVPRQLLRLGAA